MLFHVKHFGVTRLRAGAGFVSVVSNQLAQRDQGHPLSGL